jgi:hypothetical protein
MPLCKVCQAEAETVGYLKDIVSFSTRDTASEDDPEKCSRCGIPIDR